MPYDNNEPEEMMVQKSYTTGSGEMTMRIAEPMPAAGTARPDSLVIELSNASGKEGMTGEWFRIERLLETDGGMRWQELPVDRSYENADGEVAIIFNSVGWIIAPGGTLSMTVKPWFYEREWQPGTYRLAKSYSYPPYPGSRSDTAYVEFQIKGGL